MCMCASLCLGESVGVWVCKCMSVSISEFVSPWMLECVCVVVCMMSSGDISMDVGVFMVVFVCMMPYIVSA